MKNYSTLFLFFSFALLFSSVAVAQEKSNAYFVNAKEFLRIDSLNLALIELDSATKLASNFSEAYFLKAQIWEKKNEPRKAIGQYSLTILHNPEFVAAYLSRAALHHKLKDHRNYVLNDVNKAISLQPNNDELYQLKAYYYASTLSPKDLKPDFKNAIITINSAIAINPSKSKYYKLRSDYKLRSNQKLSALLDINKAIEISKTEDQYYHHRSIIRFSMSDFRSALNDINKAIEIEDSLSGYYQMRGNVYYNLKKYDQAYKNYTSAITLLFKEIVESKSKLKSSNPLNIKLRQTLLLRGMTLVQENKPFDGCNDFKRALQMGESKANNYIRQYCR
ncbi:MAG: hypothetical protein L3J06_08080 [Cyclobacteriaceae bacterium]|nr:hypothetical protein [Cyclobacteriaceae bacterium]